MSRILALIGNRPDVCRALAQQHATAHLRPGEEGGAVGWGVGFYQGGEALLRRRPVDDRGELEILALSDALSGLILAQVRTPSIGALRTENTPPYRYKNWLFAMRGTVPGFDEVRGRILESMPDFLRCSVRGETDGEAMFYSFLSCLAESGGLARDSVSVGDLGAALRQCALAVDRLTSREVELGMFAANGECLAALDRSGTLAHLWMDALPEVPMPSEEPSARASAEPFRCTAVTSGGKDVPDGWSSVAPDSMLLCTRVEPPVIEPL